MQRVLLVVLITLAGCAKQRIKFESPVGDELVLTDKRMHIEIPSVEELKPGHYDVTLEVTRDHARDLGFSDAFELYGYLIVGRVTENSSLTNVVLEVPDEFIIEARKEGKVLETVVYDDGEGGAVLVRLKLGEIKPK